MGIESPHDRSESASRLVRCESRSHGESAAAGVRAARAPIVAFAEDHCFPEPAWARALLEAYAAGDIAAVGAVFRNANPGTLVSWCDFAIAYGPWIDPTPGGDQPFIAGHNSSYRRDVLLELGGRLDDLLESETVLHLELRARGKRVVVVDDSLVRGTTSRKIVKMLRAAGAREVHLRISAPPTTHPCYYGIDTPTRSELVAASHSLEEIVRYVTCDSLGYLSHEGMMSSVQVGNEDGTGYCSACFTGAYPVALGRGDGDLVRLRRNR